MNYRLLNRKGHCGAAKPALLVGDEVYDVDMLASTKRPAALAANDMLEIFRHWPECDEIFSRFAEVPSSSPGKNSERCFLSDVELLAPIESPGVLYCAGANYRDHLIEMTGKAPRKEDMQPFFFQKPPRATITGPGAKVCLPAYAKQVDWEAEIAMVIGREASHVGVDGAMSYVAGLTILNDLSARDLMKRSDVPFLFDWIGQKCFPGSAPLGPWITPLAAIDDLYDISIKLWVNGELHQDSNSREMLFGFEEQIAYLSRHVTLYPGDVIATGTPAGVGHAKGEYLAPGDLIRIELGGLGALETRIA